MRFVWDPEKDRANQQKHHLSFALACEVFDDPLHRSIAERVVDGEQRWQTIGMIGTVLVVIVAHTFVDDEDETIARIISARKATRRERRDYENA